MTGKHHIIRRATGVAGLVLATAAGAFTVGAAPALASPTTRYVATDGVDVSGETVNDCTDPAEPCKTIQHAADVAARGDTLLVAAGTYRESVNISKSLTVQGATTGRTLVEGHSAPTFLVQPPSDSQAVPVVHLLNLDVSHNADAPGVIADGSEVRVGDSAIDDNAGGGLFAVFSVVAVTNSTLAANTGSGVTMLLGSADIDHSTLHGNAGGGVTVIDVDAVLGLQAERSVQAVAPPQTSTATVDHSTVSNNETGGVVNYGGATVVRTSTITGNFGGGVVTLAGSAEVQDSTITHTKPFPKSRAARATAAADEQSGLLSLTGDESDAGALEITPTDKAALRAGLTRYVDQHPAAQVRKAAERVAAAAPAAAAAKHVTVKGTIIADQNGVDDCQGTITDHGYNLSGDVDNSCKFSRAKHDLVKTNPRLGPLADNGGATKTEILKKGSPAIDAVPAGKAGCVTGATDQRDVERPQPTHGPCDIGAVELKAKPIVIHPGSLPHGTVGDAYHATLTATGGAYPTYAFSLAPGSSLPDGLSMDADGHITGTPTEAGTFKFTVSVNDPVLKSFAIVIEDAGPNGAGTDPLSATGTSVLPMTAGGAGAILAGFLLMVGAGLIDKRSGRRVRD